MSEGLHDARVNGDGTVSPGTYGSVLINGAGVISGELRCRELTINGTGRCAASVEADSISINGGATFEGPVRTSEFKCVGSTDVHAGMGVSRLKVRGKLSMDGGLAAGEVDLGGELRVGASATVDSLTGEGRFVVGDVLESARIELRIHGQSAANTVRCQTMRLRAPEGFTAVFTAFADRRLVADTIEGGELELIDTTAKLVRGARVTLGEGCRIDVVEYSDVLQKLAGAQVGEERRVVAG
jgi:cytoskeletal protein CcmA (bactofilin family)